uniref:Protein AATF n=1 Tax=Panagrolaimus superbus TaxID=310955 RepID=A0A914Y4J4_9BILA
MASLRQQLEELTNPTPLLPDLEDDEDIDGTSSRKIFQQHDEVDEIDAGTRRLRQAINLEETDKKYQGKKITKAEIFGDSSGFSLIKDHNSEFESDEEEGDEDDCDAEDDDEGEEDYDMNGSHLQNDDDEEENDEEELEDDDEKDMNGIKTMEETDTSSAQKGESVQAQLAIWDRIMHLTIKTHAALRSFNQLPRGEAAKELNKNLSEETKADVKKLRQNIFESTSVLLDVDKIFLQRKLNEKDDDDEEIESSEDEKDDDDDKEDEDEDIDDEDENMEEEEDEMEHSNKTNRDLSSSRLHHLQKSISLRDSDYSKIRSSVLTKWDDRTKLVGRKTKKNDLSALESSIMKQIDRVLSDKYRLLRRTQTKRSDSERLRGLPESAQDPEIFDDDDFYQALLKDFIDQKSSQTNDPVAMSRQFLELQKLRQKRTKKIVDTKATKGRKIRYVTIPKMVNFFPACPESVEWAHEKRNELFKSLFK